MDEEKYSIQFRGENYVNIVENGETKFGELIATYFKRIEKPNLLVNNVENIYFIYNGHTIKKSEYEKKILNSKYYQNFSQLKIII